MKLKFLLATGLLASAFTVVAQNANKGFAITGDGNKDYMWMNIRQVDLGTGQITNTVFDRNATTYDITRLNDNATATTNWFPTESFVAAAAYDKRNEKLFFVPMRVGELRWMDVNVKNNKPSFTSINIPNYVPSPYGEEANNITRMVIAADNNGYAITNDGNHLYKFTTGKKPVIVDMGALIDADENKGLSVHNKCSSWGGDMIADAFGKLYIIAATKSVFVVDVNTRVATYKGTITGLPANYTTNGAAVNANGDVVLCSATAFDGYYKMNMANLVATKIEGSDVKYNAADLASSNLLLQKEADQARSKNIVALIPANTVVSENAIFPNPVTGTTFSILFAGKYDGMHTVIITDLAGRNIQTVRTAVVKGQQVQQVNLRSRPTQGTYLVRVLNEKGVEILSDKMVIL